MPNKPWEGYKCICVTAESRQIYFVMPSVCPAAAADRAGSLLVGHLHYVELHLMLRSPVS